MLCTCTQYSSQHTARLNVMQVDASTATHSAVKGKGPFLKAYQWVACHTCRKHQMHNLTADMSHHQHTLVLMA
jgi:hypothetical protein